MSITADLPFRYRSPQDTTSHPEAPQTMRITEKERTEAIEELRALLHPGDTVSCILRHVSKSGMSRVIDLYYKESRIGHMVARALGYSYDYDRMGLKVGGAGMDMGFQVVYNLGRVLFPDGFGIEQADEEHERPATRERAAEMVAQGATFWGRNGDSAGWDNDGGYALSHRWL